MIPDRYPALTKFLEDALAGPPTIIIHNLAHATGALAAAEAAGTAVRLLSAPGAAAHGGAAWFKEVVAAARARHPGAEAETVLDCGAEPGLALGAIRAGVEAIRIKARPTVRARIAAMASAAGCRLVTDTRIGALDLLDARDPQMTVGAWLRAVPRRH
ncbi:MAG: hypothetical protein O7D27_05875 [Alphaproteobacteria bacterium]|nr:hypothetical protein [Alphaproteobacteria bacterium]MCZ6813336.1 hypothetical protein [Alphaproteobacteria bacterium]